MKHEGIHCNIGFIKHLRTKPYVEFYRNMFANSLVAIATTHHENHSCGLIGGGGLHQN